MAGKPVYCAGFGKGGTACPPDMLSVMTVQRFQMSKPFGGLESEFFQIGKIYRRL